MAPNPNESPEIIDISDSDSEPGGTQPLLPTQASLANNEERHSSPSELLDVLVINSTDSEDLDELEAKLKCVDFGGKFSGITSRARLTTSGSTRTRSHMMIELKETQDDVLVLSSTEEDNVDAQPIIQNYPSNSNSSTKMPRPSVRLRKRKSHIIDENPKVLNDQEKEQLKERAKLQRDINKLVTDRKSTLKDFTVELSRTFEGRPFVDYLQSKLATHGCHISFFDPPPQGEFLIRFRRQHIARYDNQMKEWIPRMPLLSRYSKKRLPKRYQHFGTLIVSPLAHRSSSWSTGLMHIINEKDGHKDKRSKIESALTTLQALERCFIVQVEGAEDTAQWLFNITGDLGIRPHKRIRESFLPFCTDTQVKCGSSKADTYKKMLQQIRNITESAAEGIIKEAPTLRQLFEGYAREPDACNRHDRLKETTVSRRKDGAPKSRILNQALSKRVHDVMWGEDCLSLV
ncbi:hypothetical protein OPQ81_007115 [Rhizoctonia solani]|nr:hypothetical protein OPQ81_007115 [Rhizoctonia solani]